MVLRSRNFRSVVAFMIAATLSGSFAFAGSGLVSEPAPGKITVDGLSTDWDEIDQGYLADSVRTLGISHDTESLYLMWRFSDERLARKILARGVTVWVNGDAKKKETVGVRYSGSLALAQTLLPPEESRNGEYGPADQDRKMGRNSTFRQPGVVTLIDGMTETDFPEDHPLGPSAASTHDQQFFCYEIRIPLALVGGKVAERPADEDRKLTLGIQIGGLSPSEKKDAKTARGEMSGGGMSGGGMGGRGGGMGGGKSGGGVMGGGHGRSGGGRMAQPKIVWLKIELEPVP